MEDKEINYNEPFLIDTVFKTQPTATGVVPEEVTAELACTWQSIASLQSYPYDDDANWEKFRGPKFYMTLYDQGTHLCIGDFRVMFKAWKKFKKEQYG